MFYNTQGYYLKNNFETFADIAPEPNTLPGNTPLGNMPNTLSGNTPNTLPAAAAQAAQAAPAPLLAFEALRGATTEMTANMPITTNDKPNTDSCQIKINEAETKAEAKAKAKAEAEAKAKAIAYADCTKDINDLVLAHKKKLDEQMKISSDTLAQFLENKAVWTKEKKEMQTIQDDLIKAEQQKIVDLKLTFQEKIKSLNNSIDDISIYLKK